MQLFLILQRMFYNVYIFNMLKIYRLERLNFSAVKNAERYITIIKKCFRRFILTLVFTLAVAIVPDHDKKMKD